MTASKKNSFRLLGGLIVLGCALLIIILRIADWATSGEKLQLGIAAVLLPLGTVLVATSRSQKSSD